MGQEKGKDHSLIMSGAESCASLFIFIKGQINKLLLLLLLLFFFS